MQLHLRNVYRSHRRLSAEERGTAVPIRAIPPGGTRIEYSIYRYFQGPYATRDTAQVTLEDGDALALLTRARLDRGGQRLESHDPIWPRVYDLAAAEIDVLAALEPGATVAALVDRGVQIGLEPERVRGLLTRLLREGVLYLDRGFRPD